MFNLELYEKARRELVKEGHAGPGFDPYNKYEDVQVLSLDLTDSFILYRVLPSHIAIEFIYVAEDERGMGVGKAMIKKLKDLVKSKASWPKSIRAEILEGNEASLSLLKEFRTRLIEKEITV